MHASNSFCASRLLLTWVLVFLISPTTQAQETPRGIYVIFDASGSMWGQLPDRSYKIHVARDVLGDFLAGDFGDTVLAFRAYGHRNKGDCRDSQLVAPFGTPDEVAGRIRPFLRDVDPLGMTPIAYSLDQALQDFGDRPGEVILITDGIETCDADPCALVRDWKARGVKLNVHVVGFGVAEEEKASLQCIADAAGTPYREAASGMDLTLGLEAIQESIAGAAGIPPQHRSVGFWLRGVTGEGAPIRVEGRLVHGDTVIPVASNKRNPVPAGDYMLEAGVPTADGSLYTPITLNVSVSGADDTEITVQVTEPPSISARFVSDGDPVRGSLISAFQNGEAVFQFRWMDEVFVHEGAYLFRAAPNQDNVLEISETIEAGERKELLFEMTPTVRAIFRMTASGSGMRLRGNYVLWQNGEARYNVHTNNGADIQPGTYDVHLDNDLIPYVAQHITVDAAGEIPIEVPAGHVTFVYQDAAGNRVDDKRVFVGRGDTRRQATLQSGAPIPLIPGTYNAAGWPSRNYDPVVFEIEAGVDQEIFLKAKE